VYFLRPDIKQDPVKRWSLPDRIFFGHGACHILAGVYLRAYPSTSKQAFWIRPARDYPGNHIFVSDGEQAFDFHGHVAHDRLIAHHTRGWSKRYPDWAASVEVVEFDLLCTAELNRRNMRGPDQFHGDPIHEQERRQLSDKARA
jgi:hypothetical protein